MSRSETRFGRVDVDSGDGEKDRGRFAGRQATVPHSLVRHVLRGGG
jgi:hypothetical protein